MSRLEGKFSYGFAAGAIFMAVIAAAVLLTTNRSSSPAPTISAPPPASTELVSAERISVEEAKRLLERGQAVVIDVRDVDSFVAGHIPGALQIPLSYVQGEIPYFPRDKKLISYCT